MKQLLRILVYTKPYGGRMFIMLCCMVASTLLQVVPVFISGDFINVLTGGSTGSRAVSLLPDWLGGAWLSDIISSGDTGRMIQIVIAAMILVAITRLIISLTQAYLFGKVGASLIYDVRNQLFEHLQLLSLKYYQRRDTGELMSRILNDVGTIQNMLTSTFLSFITNAFTVVVFFSFLLNLNWRMTLLSLLLLPPLLLNVRYFNFRIRRISHVAMEQMAIVSSYLQESISGIRVVQSFVGENLRKAGFKTRTRELVNIGVKSVMLGSLQAQVAALVVTGGTVAFLWYGFRLVMAGSMSWGGVFAFFVLLMMFVGPMTGLIQINVQIQGALAAFDRIFDVLDRKPEVGDRDDAVPFEGVEKGVVFEDVSFEYEEGRPVLKDISFQISRGDTIALVGPSGAGKTTLVNLLCRFYDPLSGKIIIDGRDLRAFQLRSLRQHIGIVDQETFLFNESFLENIRFGREVDEEAVVEAARAAYIHEFIKSLPNGYQTRVGERGVKLSGGQRQRISIARAILKNPPILILDEATSSLDSHSERSIQLALENLMGDRTAFIIAHRLSTVQRADLILVLENGLAVQAGKYRQLLDQEGLFKDLHDEQFQGALASAPPRLEE